MIRVDVKDINENNNITCVCVKHINVKRFEFNDCSVTCAEGKQDIDNLMCKKTPIMTRFANTTFRYKLNYFILIRRREFIRVEQKFITTLIIHVMRSKNKRRCSYKSLRARGLRRGSAAAR